MKMKKILLTTILAVCMFVLAGCDLSSVTKLEFYSQPKIEYLQNENTSNEKVLIKIHYSSGSPAIEEVALSKFEGFSTAALGEFTATYTNSGVSISFDYTVVSSFSGTFAGGDGSASNPYLIASTAQFKLINSVETEGKYFKLAADISVSMSDTVKSTLLGWSVIIDTGFAGVFDGDNKTITAVNNNESVVCFIFGENSGTGTKIQNLKVKIDGLVTLIAGFGTTRINGKYTIAPEVLDITNVEISGKSISAYNYSPFLSQSRGQVTLTNCVNRVEISGVDGNSAAFAIYNSENQEGTITLVNCINYGNITAPSAAAYLANPTGLDKVTKVTITNCQNYGTITTLGGRGDINAYPGILAPGYDADGSKMTKAKVESNPNLVMVETVSIDECWNNNNIVVNENDANVSYYIVQIELPITLFLRNGTESTVSVYQSKLVMRTGDETNCNVEKLSMTIYESTDEVDYSNGFAVVERAGTSYYTYVSDSVYASHPKKPDTKYRVFAYDANDNVVKVYC